jgi:uncharacterized protein (TIGR03437 family)
VIRFPGGARSLTRVLRAAAFFLCALPAWCHALATLVPQGALHARGNRLVDDAGQLIQLRGAVLPGLNLANPAPDAVERQTVASMTSVTFGVLRYRWNLNAVRLPVSVPIWQRDGPSYLDRVAGIVRLATDQGLVVILAACENPAAGASADLGLPTPAVADFWRVWAAAFKDNPHVIFDLYHQPSTRSLPNASPAQRSPADWQVWRKGGTLPGGQRLLGLQDLTDAVRSTGATQLVAAQAFHDALGFQGFGADSYLNDANLLYEFHPYFNLAVTDAQRNAAFGFLSATFPVYAGEWGLTLADDTPGCAAVPRDISAAIELLFEILSYFELHNISWTAYAFEPASLLLDFQTYGPTQLNKLWTCGLLLNPQPGMGELILLWMTGDPLGFGSVSRDQVASAAGGPAAPVAPGAIVSLYGFLFGPATNFSAGFDASGRLPTTLGEVQVLFDGVPAPLFYVGPFQINVQAPYSLAGQTKTNVQVLFRGIPSNVAALDVVPAVPEIFTGIGTSQAAALNQDGSINGAARPAAGGEIVVLFGTGAGVTSPPVDTGRPSGPPYPPPALRVSLAIGGRSADVLFAGTAPGFVGLLQVNARVPDGVTGFVPVVLTVGDRAGRNQAMIWTR